MDPLTDVSTPEVSEDEDGDDVDVVIDNIIKNASAAATGSEQVSPTAMVNQAAQPSIVLIL